MACGPTVTLLWNLVTTQLKVRYQRTALGFLWTLLHPLLLLGVLSLVFSQIMDCRFEQYAAYLFSGMIPWQCFAASVENGGRSLILNEHLIRKVGIPKITFPMSEVGVALVNMLFAMVALFFLFVLLGAKVHAQLVLLPAAVFLLGAFSLGASLVSMTLMTKFRDFEHFTGVLLQLLYFLSPILYPPSVVNKYVQWLKWNPLTHLLELFHAAIYYGVWPSGQTWVGAVGSAALMLFVGYSIFKRQENEYVFYL